MFGILNRSACGGLTVGQCGRPADWRRYLRGSGTVDVVRHRRGGRWATLPMFGPATLGEDGCGWFGIQQLLFPNLPGERESGKLAEA